MIFFGHVGITTAVVKAYENISKQHKDKKNKVHIDYRVVMIGSILPDIIDKPIGAYFFRNVFHNSRIFAHSLIFSIILISIGAYYFYKKKNNNVLLLGVGSFIHLILDSMWLYPRILFWPFSGGKFPTRPEGNWLASDMIGLMRNPYVYGPEIIGALIIIYYLFKNRKQLRKFIINGTL